MFSMTVVEACEFANEGVETPVRRRDLAKGVHEKGGGAARPEKERKMGKVTARDHAFGDRAHTGLRRP